MGDRSTHAIVEALSRAATEPVGVRLYAGKSAPGLFPTTAPARLAAQRCLDEGYLRLVCGEPPVKSAPEVCAITDKGLKFLMHQVSPRQVLEDFVRALESRQKQLAELLGVTRQVQADLDALRHAAHQVLQHLELPDVLPFASNGTSPCPAAILAYLRRRQELGASEDCPLPELFQHCRLTAPDLTIGRFHDGLRALHDQQQVYLHPWTGPLYQMPDPPYALLVGHEIAYYASLR